MADVNDPTKPGEQTSENALASSVNVWGTIVTVLGIVTSIGSTIVPGLGENTKWGIIAGAVLACACAITKALPSMGYSASRSAVKVAQIENQKAA